MGKRQDEIFVSVIMPTYNTQSQYLKEAIESILNQTHKNFEFWITIDGSTNDDLNIIKAFSEKDNRIKIIDNIQNQGIVYSLNNMIDHCRGKYVFRMDADDISVKNRLEITIDYLESHPRVDICGGAVRYIVNGVKQFRKRVPPSGDNSITLSMLFGNPMFHPTVTFRTASLNSFQICYSKNEKAKDYNMWIDCSIKEMCFDNINNCVLFYRIHNGQGTSIFKDELSLSGQRILRKWLNAFHVNYSKEQLEAFYRFSRRTGNVSTDELIASDCLLKNILVTMPQKRKKQAEHVFSNLFFKKCLKLIVQKQYTVGQEINVISILDYGYCSYVRKLILKIVGCVVAAID